MSNNINRNNHQNDQKIAQGIKDTAGAAFHTVHGALETVEDAAMSAVDATANATSRVMHRASNMIDDITDDKDGKRENNNGTTKK